MTELKKKLIITLDCDDAIKIKKFQDEFLKHEITTIPKGVIEVYECDENNNIVRVL